MTGFYSTDEKAKDRYRRGIRMGDREGQRGRAERAGADKTKLGRGIEGKMTSAD